MTTPPIPTPRLTHDELVLLSKKFEELAKNAKRNGHFYLFLTVAIGVSILLLFAFGPQLDRFIRFSVGPITIYANETTPDFSQFVGAVRETDSLTKVDDNTRALLMKGLASQMEHYQPNVFATTILPALTSTIVRIGAVAIGIYLVQIMVSFARYYYRLRDHLVFCAEAVLISGGSIAGLGSALGHLLPKFDFGKMPNSPIEKLADSALKAIGELAKKLPPH